MNNLDPILDPIKETTSAIETLAKENPALACLVVGFGLFCYAVVNTVGNQK